MFAWRVKTSECMDMPGVLVAGSGVQEVIKKGILFWLFMGKFYIWVDCMYWKS